MKEKFMRFMMGRYGADDYSKFLLGLSVALMVLNLFLRIPFLNIAIFAVLVYVYVRMFSKNIQKRYAENMKYLDLKGRFFGYFQKENVWHRTGRRIIFISARTANRRSVCPEARGRSVSPVRNVRQNLQRRAEYSAGECSVRVR